MILLHRRVDWRVERTLWTVLEIFEVSQRLLFFFFSFFYPVECCEFEVFLSLLWKIARVRGISFFLLRQSILIFIETGSEKMKAEEEQENRMNNKKKKRLQVKRKSLIVFEILSVVMEYEKFNCIMIYRSPSNYRVINWDVWNFCHKMTMAWLARGGYDDTRFCGCFSGIRATWLIARRIIDRGIAGVYANTLNVFEFLFLLCRACIHEFSRVWRASVVVRFSFFVFRIRDGIRKNN